MEFLRLHRRTVRRADFGTELTVEKVFLLLAAALLHEAGHVLCAALLRIPFSGLTFRPCGAVMTFDFSGATYGRELCVHLAGPLTGVLSAVCALFVFGDTAAYFSGLSVWLAVLNLLPVEGFDGGGVLSCLLAPLLPPQTVYRICRTFSILAVLLLWTAVLWIELRVCAGMALLLFILYLLIFYTENCKV